MEVEVEELRAELLLWALLLEEVEPPTLDTDHVLTVMPPPACRASRVLHQRAPLLRLLHAGSAACEQLMGGMGCASLQANC